MMRVYKKILCVSVLFIFIPAIYIAVSPYVVFCQIRPAEADERVPVETVAVLSGDELMGRFSRTSGIFYDSIKKRIYVTDTVNRRLVSFDSMYKFLAELRDDIIKMPLSIVKDSRGFFYVVDGEKGSILFINVRKKLIEELVVKGDKQGKGEIFPGRMVIDGRDRLYVIDKLHRRIVIINNDGAFIRSFTVNEKEFYGFNDVKVSSSGSIFALDTVAGVVYIFDGDGNVISKFGKRGSSEKDFKFPVSLALDRDGFIYVLDGHASRVQVFDGSGNLKRTLLKKGANEGELMHPTYIYIDHENRIFIADQSRVQIFREIKE